MNHSEKISGVLTVKKDNISFVAPAPPPHTHTHTNLCEIKPQYLSSFSSFLCQSLLSNALPIHQPSESLKEAAD